MVGKDREGKSFHTYLHTRNHAFILALHHMKDSVTIRNAIDAIEKKVETIEKKYRSAELNLKVRVWGKPTIFVEMAERVPRQAPWNVFSSLLFVFCAYTGVIWVLNWRYHKQPLSPLWGGWTLSQPLVCATGITGCVMALGDISLNIATAPINEIAIAAAADFNIYLAIAFLFYLYCGLLPQQAMKNAFDEKAKAVIDDHNVNSQCFVLLIASSLEQVAELGGLMILNLFICVAWGLFMTLPMLAANAEKRKEITDEKSYQFDRMRRAASFLW